MTAAWPVVCATGHRPQHLPPACHGWVRDELARVATKLRDEYGTRVGISGMALGVDLWWAQAVLDARMTLWAYIPCDDQAARWKPQQRREWERLRAAAAKVRAFGGPYSVKLLYARNDGMLADSAAVVAVHRPSKTSGGTASAVAKAERQRLPRIHIDPDARTVRLIDYPVIGAGRPHRPLTPSEKTHV